MSEPVRTKCRFERDTRWCVLLVIMGVTLVVAGLVLTVSAAVAQGTRDQVNDPETGSSFGCGSAGASLGQSFTPTMPGLVGVELRLRSGGSFPAEGLRTTINVRGGDMAGPVLGTAAASVPGPQPAGTMLLVRFDYRSVVTVIPGNKYVIEWLSPAPAGEPAGTFLTWMGRQDSTYPGGEAYGCTGSPIPGQDRNFITYGQSAAAPTPAPTPTPAEPVCPQIRDRVPPPAIAAALANPAHVRGYDKLEKPGLPPGPYNRRRTWLTMLTLALPYHELHNGLVYRAGCP